MTTIKDFFDQVDKSTCPQLQRGSSSFNDTIKKYYEQYIDPYMPEYEIIEAWHKLLKGYYYGCNNQCYRHIEKGAKTFQTSSVCEDQDVTIETAEIKANACTVPDDVLFIRRYASSDHSNSKKWDIRRGFLTRFYRSQNAVKPYLQYVYVDNFFAQYFYAMAINGFVPSMQEFRDFIRNRQIPYGYLDTSSERQYQAYKKGKQYPLNTNGWKLSHMYSANKEDYDIKSLGATNSQGKTIAKYSALCNMLFPKGVYTDYRNHNNSAFPYRIDTTNFVDWQIKIIKAHFIRVVHPINYFLTPKVAKHFFEKTVGVFTDIGEYNELIEYVKYRIAKKYGKIFSEFKTMALANDCVTHNYSATVGAQQIKITFGMGVFNQKGAKVQFADYYIAKSLYKFLFENWTFADIDKTILNYQHDRKYNPQKPASYNKASVFVHDIGLETADIGTLDRYHISGNSICQCTQSALNALTNDQLDPHYKDALDYIIKNITVTPSQTPWQQLAANGGAITGTQSSVLSSNKATSKRRGSVNTQHQSNVSQSNAQVSHKKISYDSSLVTKNAADREVYLLNGVPNNYKNGNGLKKISEINNIVNNLFQNNSLFDLTDAQEISRVWADVKMQPWDKSTGHGIPSAIVSNYCFAVTGQKPRRQ